MAEQGAQLVRCRRSQLGGDVDDAVGAFGRDCPRPSPSASPARRRHAPRHAPESACRPPADGRRSHRTAQRGVGGVDHRRGDVPDRHVHRGAGGGSGRAPNGSGGSWSAPSRSRRWRTTLRAARPPSSAPRPPVPPARRRPSRRARVRRRRGCHEPWRCGRRLWLWAPRARFGTSPLEDSGHHLVGVVTEHVHGSTTSAPFRLEIR